MPRQGPTELTDATDVSRLWRAVDFDRLEPSEQERLSRQAYTVNLAEGSHLFVEGEEVDAIFLIVKGTISCYRMSAAGRELRERVAGPGELVCPLAVADGRAATASARAVRDAQCVAIPAHLARQSLESGTVFGRAILDELARCCRRLSRHLTLLSLEGAERKVAWVLAELCRQTKRTAAAAANATRSGAFELEVTHGDLAALLGTSREVVSRALARLRELHLVETGRRHVEVVDVGLLERFARQAT